jgi:hypothetical protein
VTLDHVDPMFSLSLSSSHIGMHAFISLPKPHTFRILVYTWLVMLSHGVLRVVQVFPSFVMLSLACLCDSVVLFHPSRCEMTM